LRRRPGDEAGAADRWHGRAAHTHRVARARSARAQRRPAREPEDVAAGGMGPRLRDPDRVPTRVPRGTAAQTRTRTGAPEVLRHRARHGLPLPVRRRVVVPRIDDESSIYGTTVAPHEACMAGWPSFVAPLRPPGRAATVTIGSVIATWQSSPSSSQ